MKKYNSGLKIKKKIIIALRGHSVSLRKLETKLNVGYNPIKLHCKELEFLGIIKIKKTKEGSRNGRPYAVAELTEYGKTIKI
jgi:predicted ArsR family transcriptional regulator